MSTEIEQTLNNGTFCSLSISIWQASKKVAKGMVEIGHDADENLFRVQKDLIERDHLKPIRQAAQKAGEVLHGKSLPFQVRGIYYVPNRLVLEAVEQIRGFERDFRNQVDEFCRNYPRYREEARARLNGHFQAHDYPEDVREKFDWNLSMMAFSAPNQLQAVSPEMYQEAMGRFHQDIEEFRQNSVALLRERFAGLVSHVVERLTPEPNGTRKIFKNTLVGNLRDFLKDFEGLNFTSDQELQAQVERVRGLMNGVEPALLRDSSAMAGRIAASMSEVQKQVTAMIENAPVRRIRFKREEAA